MLGLPIGVNEGNAVVPIDSQMPLPHCAVNIIETDPPPLGVVNDVHRILKVPSRYLLRLVYFSPCPRQSPRSEPTQVVV